MKALGWLLFCTYWVVYWPVRVLHLQQYNSVLLYLKSDLVNVKFFTVTFSPLLIDGEILSFTAVLPYIVSIYMTVWLCEKRTTVLTNMEGSSPASIQDLASIKSSASLSTFYRRFCPGVRWIRETSSSQIQHEKATSQFPVLPDGAQSHNISLKSTRSICAGVTFGLMCQAHHKNVSFYDTKVRRHF